MSGGYYDYLCYYVDTPEDLLSKIGRVLDDYHDAENADDPERAEASGSVLHDLRRDGYGRAADEFEALAKAAVAVALTPSGSTERQDYARRMDPLQDVLHAFEWWKSNDYLQDQVDETYTALQASLHSTQPPSTVH